jgi:hypothetical protein
LYAGLSFMEVPPKSLSRAFGLGPFLTSAGASTPPATSMN